MNTSKKLMAARLGYFEGDTIQPDSVLEFQGGNHQQDRMIKDKYRSFKKALWYSYQGANIKLINTEQECRALINPNSTKQDYDDKIISVDHQVGVTTGSVFNWCNTGTYWLVYLQDLTELAYFRGDIRKCNYMIKWKDANGDLVATYVAVRGPVETSIDSVEKSNFSIDLPNHTLTILMPLNKDTKEHFVRYMKFFLNDVCWRVEGTDSISMPGILQVHATEYYANKDEDNIEDGIVGDLIPIPVEVESEIEGEGFIKPKGSYTYTVDAEMQGEWRIQAGKPVAVLQRGAHSITLSWQKATSGQFDLSFGDITKTIVVESLF